MRVLPYLLLFLVTTACAQERSDLDHHNLRGNVLGVFQYTYEDGQLTGSTTYGRGDTLISRAVYTLDDHGDWSSQTFINPGEDLDYRIDYTNYVYDARDNWIERHHLKDGELDVIERRSIFYREDLEKPVRERLLGTWYTPEERGSVTFMTDGSCTLDGEPGSTWAMDPAQQSLTIALPSPQPSLQFRFRLDTFRIHLTSIDGGEDITLNMR